MDLVGSQSSSPNINLLKAVRWTVAPIAVALVLAGCGSRGMFGLGSSDQTTTRNRSGVFQFDPAPTTSDKEISPQAISLAEQSQRDIASFLAQQSTTTTTTSEPAPATTESVRVLFNEPPAARAEDPGGTSELNTTRPNQTRADQVANKLVTDAPTEVISPPTATTEPPPLHIDDLDAHMERVMIEFSRELYHQSTRSDMPVRELMLLAAMTIVDPSRTISPDALPDLTEGERELLKKMQAHFVELGQSLDGSQDAVRAVQTSLASLQQSLSEQPDLAITTATLCTRVRGFGDYDELDLTQLVAHRTQQAVLYIEISEFDSELNDKNEWVTVTSQQLTIYSERDGIPVWQEDWRTAIDRSRQRRNDFFTVQLLSFPEALSVGKYQLKIRLRDDKSSAETERSIPFTLLAQPGGLGGVGD